MIKNFFDENKIEYKENTSLLKYNSYRIDTKCKFIVFPNSKSELIGILRLLKKEQLKYYILGNGSNIIFSMDYFDGVIIKLDKLNKIEIKGNIVRAQAGCSLIKLALETINNSLSGLEFATGIPGNVGGSTAMNAGAYKHSMSDVVKYVEVLDENLQIIELRNRELNFSYRDSIFKHNSNLIVVSTTFELTKGDKNTMKEIIENRRIKRQLSQPLELPNAGSVFRNPENMFAGEIIEKCNLKGYNINGAEISQKHANFIVNKGGATGKDIISLIDKVQQEIKEKYNIDLILEQIIIK